MSGVYEKRDMILREFERFVQEYSVAYTDYNEEVLKATHELLGELLKAQEPVNPILARGWYWCGGIGCRNSLTSALNDDSPVRKPNYCEKCGRAVKWE